MHTERNIRSELYAEKRKREIQEGLARSVSHGSFGDIDTQWEFGDTHKGMSDRRHEKRESSGAVCCVTK